MTARPAQGGRPSGWGPRGPVGVGSLVVAPMIVAAVAACSPRAVVIGAATSAVSAAGSVAAGAASAAASAAQAGVKAASAASAAASGGSSGGVAGSGSASAVGAQSAAVTALGGVTAEAALQRDRAIESRRRVRTDYVFGADLTDAASSCLQSMFDFAGAASLLTAAGFQFDNPIASLDEVAAEELQAEKGEVNVSLNAPFGLCLIGGDAIPLVAAKSAIEHAISEVTGFDTELAVVTATSVRCATGEVLAPGGFVQIDIVPAGDQSGCEPDDIAGIIITAVSPVA